MDRWSLPVASLALLALLLLAGCSSPTPARIAECPLTYPTGAPAPCTSVWSDAEILDPPPGAQTTWLCRDDSQGDDGNRQQIWMDASGNLGMRWEWLGAPLGGQAVVIMAIYQDGQDQLLLLPYQDVGFAQFPKPPLDQPMELHLIAYNFTLWTNTVDPFQPDHWVQVPGVELVASSFDADPWFYLRVPAADGGDDTYVSATGMDLSEAGRVIYRPKSKTTLSDDGSPSFIVQTMGGGAKFPARDPLRMRLDPGFCYLEDRPVFSQTGGMAAR